MRQVLFWIPIKTAWTPEGIPIYGFGLMLFVAFVVCTWLASRRARREGIDPVHIQDMAIWIFLGGLVGARVVYMMQYQRPLSEFFFIWQGGLVFYGSALGGVAGYFLAYVLVLRKHAIASWKVADILAPSAALGLALGRIGCLFNGCCYGNVACGGGPELTFPIHSPPWTRLVVEGRQSAAGFTLRVGPEGTERTVAAVEPGSPAARAGLRDGDLITAVNGQPVADYDALYRLIALEWPRGRTDLELHVQRNGTDEALPPFTPRTLGLHPTQVYETISTVLIFLLLTAFYPFRRHDGEVMVLFMITYAAHRFLNEMLRNDTDPVAFGMTLSQNGSLLVLAAGLLMGLYLWRKPAQYRPSC